VSALGLPAALLLGVVADLAGGLVLHLAGRSRPWFRPATLFWSDLRSLMRRKDRGDHASALELVGVTVALTGAGLAGAAAMGALAGSAALVYPALVLAVVGGHVAASLVPSVRGRDLAVRARADAILAEPAFLLALGASFARWGAFDLGAMRGAQQVLGPGLAVGPPAVAAGLVLAAVVALVVGALRLPPGREGSGEESAPAGSAASLTLSRWAAAGATAMVVAVPVVGGSSLDPGALDPAGLWAWLGGAVALAAALGAGREGLAMLPAGIGRGTVAMAAVVLAAGATALVVLG
jgi:hypothetical protein